MENSSQQIEDDGGKTMSYLVQQWVDNLRQAIWRPYEQCASDEVVVYIFQFDDPVTEWTGGFVPATIRQYDGYCGYTGVYIDTVRMGKKNLKIEAYEMCMAESDLIIARDAYERMRLSKFWRWRWKVAGRDLGSVKERKRYLESLVKSFDQIPPRKAPPPAGPR